MSRVRLSALFLTAVFLASCSGQTIPDRVTASAVAGTPQAVIQGVARGSKVLVQVRLNNPTDQPIQVEEISMTVLSVKPSSCPATALAIASFPRPIIAAKGSGEVLIKVAINKSAPRSCSNARWQVGFSSQATPAS